MRVLDQIICNLVIEQVQNYWEWNKKENKEITKEKDKEFRLWIKHLIEWEKWWPNFLDQTPRYVHRIMYDLLVVNQIVIKDRDLTDLWLYLKVKHIFRQNLKPGRLQFQSLIWSKQIAIICYFQRRLQCYKIWRNLFF